MQLQSCISVMLTILVMRSQAQFDEHPEDPDPVCTMDPSATVGPNDPRLPRALLPSFQVHIEATFINKQQSMTADEYVDTSAGMSALVIKQSGQIETLIFNYNTNETYHIQNNECTVHNLASDTNGIVIGGSFGNSRMPHTYSTGTVLRFAQEYGEVYKGQSTVRGIATDHWQSCMYWGILDANFTLDYYFTQPNWATADGATQIPVRAEVEGYRNDVDSSFHHIYDYVGFTGYVQDPTVFQTPRGVPCQGRVHTRQMPVLKSQYQYREEITQVLGASVSESDVWYDFNSGLIRFDYSPSYVAEPYYSLDAVTEIHDYNTGVAYIMDKSLGNCSIVPIGTHTFDVSRNTAQGTLHLKGPEQLFYLDNSYAYSGQRTVRGINCDVFSTIIKNYTEENLMGKNVSFEIYFMADGWSGANSIGDNTNTSDIPVRLDIFEPTTGFGVIYDFFDFDQEHPDIDNAFNIAPCFNEQHHIDFYITFPGTASDLIQHNKKVFLRTIEQKLTSVMSVSPLRIQNTEVHLAKNNIYFVGQLLDRAPPLAKFRRSPTKVAQYTNNQLIPGVVDVTSCASTCDEQTRVTCDSFDYCPQVQSCALSLQYTTGGNQIETDKTCDHYTRVISGPVAHEPPLKDAFNTLRMAVANENFTVPIAIHSSQNLIFQASGIKDNVWKKEEADIDKYSSEYSVLYNFKLSPNRQLYDMSYTFLVDVSVEDCAYICLQELDFTCNSFQYQAHTSTCAVNSLFPDSNKDRIWTTLGIDLYTRDYTSQYTETPNRLILDSNTSSVTLNNAYSSSFCAKECNRNASFPCKSFNYSPMSHTCILYSKLYYDPQDSHGIHTTLWNFYTLDYTKQFRKFWEVEFNIEDDWAITQPQDRRYSFETNVGMAIQECARKCVEMTWLHCDSFSEYYDDSGHCYLYSTSLYDVGHYEVAGVLNSFIYNREYYPDGRRYIPHVHFDKLTTSSTSPSTTTTPPTTTLTLTSTTTPPPPPPKTTTPTARTTTTRRPTTSRPTRRPTMTTAAMTPSTIKAVTHANVTPQSTQCNPVAATPCSCDCKGQITSSTSANDGHTSRVHQTPAPDHKSSYPTGTVVGVAIGMLAVGILIGVGAVYLKHSRQQHSYGKSSITNRAYSP